MTNLQIICNEAIANNLYTKEEVKQILESGYRLPIHTYAEWKRLGFQVRRGEKATIKTMLWKMTNYKKEDNEQEKEKRDHYYLTKASLFTKEQVEPIAE